MCVIDIMNVLHTGRNMSISHVHISGYVTKLLLYYPNIVFDVQTTYISMSVRKSVRVYV